MKRLALALFLVPMAAMADPPRVDVRFVVEAKQFVDGLGSSRRSVERAMTQLLLAECSDPKSYPFVQWVEGDAAAPNRLVVALVEKKSGGDFETRIEYRGTINGSALADGGPGESVYRWFEAKNVDNADILKARLQKKIHAQFTSAAFRADLLRYFVSGIPLAENVNLAGHRVIVPLPAKTLQDESELKVSFARKSDGEPGTMMLGEPLDYPERAGVLCRITRLNFGDLVLVDGWHPRIPDVLGPSKVRDVRVVMNKYVPQWFPDSHRGSVTSD
ncbi:MAG TPA: hypothetical protein VF698_19590 [Thermoanaerobaculia bacterium]